MFLRIKLFFKKLRRQIAQNVHEAVLRRNMRVS